jgi:Zn-finger nucleic acid-binding protein
MTERSGVEIDYCPTCRGVWLDRGELDKLIERATPTAAAAPVAAAPSVLPAPSLSDRPRRWDDDDDDDDDWDDRRRHTDGSKPYKKKSRTKSLLGDIFDF